VIHTQLLTALGYKGACIILSEDYHHNRHILKRNDYTLCGKKTVTQKMVLVNGRFKGYKPGSAIEVTGFYGGGKCKTCLVKYLRQRLSPEGKKLFRLYKARELMREWKKA
jgi:hypothetical protein